MKTYYFYPFFILFTLPVLHGCVASFVGAAATGASVTVDRRTLGSIVEDQAIELKAAERLYNDVILREQAHINVTSYNSIVLLTGEVPNDADLKRVNAIISTIPKVNQVHNEIIVAGSSAITSRASDALITSSVKLKLFGAKELPGNQIKVVTERGIVYLMGILTRQEGDAAADIARRVKGVGKVVTLFQFRD